MRTLTVSVYDLPVIRCPYNVVAKAMDLVRVEMRDEDARAIMRLGEQVAKNYKQLKLAA